MVGPQPYIWVSNMMSGSSESYEYEFQEVDTEDLTQDLVELEELSKREKDAGFDETRPYTHYW